MLLVLDRKKGIVVEIVYVYRKIEMRGVVEIDTKLATTDSF